MEGFRLFVWQPFDEPFHLKQLPYELPHTGVAAVNDTLMSVPSTNDNLKGAKSLPNTLG